MSSVSSTKPTFTSLLHQTNCEFVTISVGRKREFSFEKATLNQPHLKGSVFYQEVFCSQNYYCDCDSELFEKYFINYIYFGVIPKWNQTLEQGVGEVILAMANAFKLTQFADGFKKSRSETKITIQFSNFSAELIVNSTITVKDLVTRFVKKHNKNPFLEKIKPETIILSTFPDEIKGELILQMKLKNQIELKKIGDAPKIFAFVTSNKNHFSEWEKLEAAEKLEEAEKENAKFTAYNPASTTYVRSSTGAYVPPAKQETLYWKKT